MIKTLFKNLPVGTTFQLDTIEWVKTNHNKAYNIVNGIKIYTNVKKSREVETNSKYFYGN